MNKVEAVAALVGSKYTPIKQNQFSGGNTALAKVLGRHPAMVTRFVKAGSIPARYNSVLNAWARENGVSDEMALHLEQICSCCGQRLPVD